MPSVIIQNLGFRFKIQPTERNFDWKVLAWINTLMILYTMKCCIYAIIQKNISLRSLPKSSIFAHNYDNSKKNNFMIILCMLYVVLYLPSVDNRCLNFMNTSLYSKEEKKRILVLICYSLLRISSFWLLPFKTDFSLCSFYWLVKICQISEKNLHKNLSPFTTIMFNNIFNVFSVRIRQKDNRPLIELPNCQNKFCFN